MRWLAASTREAREAAHREHSEILRLVRAGNVEAAVAALREHGRDVHRQALKAIDESRRYLGARSFAGEKLGERR